ncbi:MAG TPA: hypothetical protein GXZ88_09820 [Firmicutes bacterium]|jgi:hypothetical protein|nr:hypothetical protein [Candidatus Fermentithermobacillaceae bacterium]
MVTKPWEGKHIWIWILSQVGPLDHMIRRAVDMGLSGLLVKAWDGGTSGLFLEQLQQVIEPAHHAGLAVGAWGYSYGNNISGEVKAMQKALDAGADWLVIDAEDEYENREGKHKALELGLQVTRAIGTDVVVGYTTFALPQYHENFPYTEFSSFCSVCLPQVYWGVMNIPLDEALSMCLRGLAKYGRPIAPVGQCYGEATPGEIFRFSELAWANGLKGISYYDWQHASEVQLEAVGRALYSRDGNYTDWGGGFRDRPGGHGAQDQEKPKGYLAMLRKFLERFKKEPCQFEN